MEQTTTQEECEKIRDVLHKVFSPLASGVSIKMDLKSLIHSFLIKLDDYKQTPEYEYTSVMVFSDKYIRADKNIYRVLIDAFISYDDNNASFYDDLTNLFYEIFILNNDCESNISFEKNNLKICFVVEK